MRHIQKRAQPDWYRDFKRGKTGLSWDEFSKIHPQEKSKLKDELLQEQHSLCGYCGKSIDQQHSHIEHVVPRSHLPHRAHPGVTTYSYQNLLASCQSRRRSDGEDTCGHAKGNEFDTHLFITPHAADCEGFFQYNYLGQISPLAKDEHSLEFRQARSTIQCLRLDSYELDSARKAIITGLLGEDYEIELTPEEVEKLSSYYQTPDERGRLPAYNFVALQLLKSH